MHSEWRPIIYWYISALSPSPVRARFHKTALLPCGLTPVYDEVMWVKCNPDSRTPALAIRKNNVLIHNYRHGGAKVFPNGSLKLEYVRRSDTGEYRCYGMSGTSKGLRMARLHVNGKISVVVAVRITPTDVFRLFQSLWNLTGTWAAALPWCLSNVKWAIWLL